MPRVKLAAGKRSVETDELKDSRRPVVHIVTYPHTFHPPPQKRVQLFNRQVRPPPRHHRRRCRERHGDALPARQPARRGLSVLSGIFRLSRHELFFFFSPFGGASLGVDRGSRVGSAVRERGRAERPHLWSSDARFPSRSVAPRRRATSPALVFRKTFNGGRVNNAIRVSGKPTFFGGGVVFFSGQGGASAPPTDHPVSVRGAAFIGWRLPCRWHDADPPFLSWPSVNSGYGSMEFGTVNTAPACFFPCRLALSRWPPRCSLDENDSLTMAFCPPPPSRNS